MTILVTGALGFVGINLTARLAADGHRVVAADLADPDPDALRFLGPARDAIAFRCCDVRDASALSAIMAEAGVERIVHAAVITATLPEQERLRAAETVAVNVGGTATLLEAAAHHGVKEFVYISSASVYGFSHGAKRRITEKTPPRPEGLYAITKVASEAISRRLARVHGIRLRVLRLTQPYGPMERPSGGRSLVSAIYDWVRAAAQGREVAVPDGSLSRDFTYITDITDGIARALLSNREETYNLSLAIPYSVGEVLREIQGQFPAFRFHLGRGEVRPDINRGGLRPPLGSSRARREFGFRPTVKLPEGIAAYADWVKAFGIV